jgi:pimeloyl-ACP methyl ester carboxylesterase
MLELIDKGSCSKAHPAPLLFVHGANHAAWCWDEHFLDFFADKGYRAVALSLRGHGGSPTDKPANGCSIADYVDDVCSVVADLPTTPVLIGHSMGGFVVQKYLESRTAPAGILVASVPPRTYLATVLRGGIQHPWIAAKVNVSRNLLALYASPSRTREVLFSPHTPQPVVEKCLARLEDADFRAVCLDMPLTDLVRTRRVTTPLLVLDGEYDSWGPSVARATARAYHTEAEFFPDMGHNMMLEPGWAVVAERIHTWLEMHAPASQAKESGEQDTDQ